MLNLLFLFTPGRCGYFCLKYVLKRRIKNEAYMSMYKIKEVLNKYGYYCVGMKLKNICDIKRGCITLIKSGKESYHYIVIKEVRNNFVFYYDPLFINVRKKKITKFIEKWSNICLFYTKV